MRVIKLSTFASVLALLGGITMAQAQDAGAPHLPDLTAYNCTTSIADKTATTRHIGQVIQGRYHEWYEYRVQVDGEPRLGCISVSRPTPQQLTVDEAKTFLTNSFAVGMPTAAAQDRETTQSSATSEPDNTKPEPLKRILPAPASGSTTEQKSSIGAPLPTPASKSFDDQSAQAPVAKPAIERNTAQSTTAQIEKPATVGVEDRTQVANTQLYPWTTLTYLTVTYPSGDSYRCSATAVSAYVVLTAGHCVHNNTRGGYITSARVYPAQSQVTPGDGNAVRPYGVKSDVSQVQTTSQWTQISGDDSYDIQSYRYDFAAIQFKTAFTHTSTFMPVIYDNANVPVLSAGYPATVNNTNTLGLYIDSGNETSQSLRSLHSVHVREFAIDASPGNSGGPFIYVDGSTNQRYLVGSLSYGDDTNDQAGGPWYDSWNQALVSSWVSWTPAAASVGTVSGLRVASVFSSAIPGMTSYVRFYNAGSTSGTVEVTLSDYATGSVLGTWTSGSIAGHRTRQYALSEIESATNAVFTKPTVYSLSVRPTFTGTFQNTLWNNASQSLVNISTCDTPSTDRKSLMYVHASMLAPYTSTVVIHNTGASAVSPTLTVYNAETGAKLASYTTKAIPANGQLNLDVASLEKAAGISSTTAYHYNIVAETAFTGYMQQFLNNQPANVIADMTAACAMTP
jgi:V8-like Glu-specific endopeptidase